MRAACSPNPAILLMDRRREAGIEDHSHDSS